MLTESEPVHSLVAGALWQTGHVAPILLSLLFGAPWLVGIVWVASRAPRTAEVPPSLAESVQRRLWVS
jgi:hypothetical protein